MTKKKAWYETVNSHLRQKCHNCGAIKKDKFKRKYNLVSLYSWCTRCQKETETWDEVGEAIEAEMRAEVPI